MRTNAPIGIFDSGLGGLTVVKYVFEKLPQESIIYIGDQIHVPYGEKTPGEIRNFALGISEYLINQGSKLIIMACNMSSANALRAACEVFPDIPIVGTIDAGARAAIRISSGKIGVLATKGTVKTLAYTNTITALNENFEVLEQACPRFVPIVEAGLYDTPDADNAASEYVKPLIDAGCDTLVLGCTHYPVLINSIRKAAGPDVDIIDPAVETVSEASEILRKAGILNPPHTEPAHVYYTSAEPQRFAALGSNILGNTICSVQELTWGLDLREIEWHEKTAERTIRHAV